MLSFQEYFLQVPYLDKPRLAYIFQREQPAWALHGLPAACDPSQPHKALLGKAHSWRSSPGERDHPYMKASYLGSAPVVDAAWLHRDEAESGKVFT